jgi:EamA domain-containing membrane protein RarD
MLLVSAALVCGQSFTALQAWTFVMICTAVAIYSIDSVRTYRRISSGV